MSNTSTADHTAGASSIRVHALHRALKTHWKTLFGFSFMINLLTLCVPMFLLQVYDRVIPNHSHETLWVLALICVIGLLALATLEHVRQTMLDHIARWAEQWLAPDLLHSAILRAVRRGDPSSSILKDAARLSRFASSGTVTTMLDVPWTPIFLLAIALLHPLLGLLVLAGALILAGMAVLHERLIHRDVEQADGFARTADDAATRLISNAEAIQAMGMQADVARRWAVTNAQRLDAEQRIAEQTSVFHNAARFCRLLLQIAVVGGAAWLVMQGQLTAGAIIAALLLMRRAIAPLEGCIQNWKSAVEARTAWQRITEYLAKVPVDNPEPMPLTSGDLIGRNLSYKFRDAERSVFSRLDFEFAAGRSVAITGDTGSGKSTLARMLVGAKRSPGGLLSLGGFDLSAWQPSQYGMHIGYLPQDIELFDGTIRDNIARFTDASLASVISAARQAGAHDLIQRLPGGYHFEIGHAGTRLSGGQRQRIALARAMFGNPRLLVLDEPDANLDGEGTIALAVAVKQATARGALVIMVTHDDRLRSLADEEYSLHDGRLRRRRKDDGTEVPAKLSLVKPHGGKHR